MNNQRGGTFTVSGWLALTLLALCAIEGVAIRHLLHHRAIEIHATSLGSRITPKDDEYVTHCFPDDCEVCDAFNNICSIRI